MPSASAITRILKANDFPGWSFKSQQTSEATVLTLDDEIALGPELDRMIHVIESRGYATQLNGSRYLLVLS